MKRFYVHYTNAKLDEIVILMRFTASDMEEAVRLGRERLRQLLGPESVNFVLEDIS